MIKKVRASLGEEPVEVPAEKAAPEVQQAQEQEPCDVFEEKPVLEKVEFEAQQPSTEQDSAQVKRTPSVKQ
ncbi:Oidioi.mRNA.OKI2018_I69.PAR.g9619.t1.cds [Oikopleura dioica]|uniref:Oidioi.mRNA.OKI2018_I69.PAR.g9619.t1.cds n=1 Tax=Oikopleura dioica TaxID=34765 RepID=A0ABN7RLF3_OIKDI|nr:Oidioi.mRNA.OKI2018_I69.PAR.g9619.t1.cds [Oikopleura dioica]